MRFHRPTLDDFAIAFGYFLAGTIAVSTTRFNGGVAMLWAASALLIAALAYRPREQWPTLLGLCAIAGILLTGWFGFGWEMALPFTAINLVEAAIGAWLLRRSRTLQAPLGSLGWLWQFVFATALAAPAVASLLAGAVRSLYGVPFWSTYRDFYIGHALGNLTFVPIFSLLLSGSIGKVLRSFRRAQTLETAAILLLVTGVTVLVFGTTALPFLFVPFAPVVLAAFRAGQIGAALSLVVLALVGGGLTLAGHGPLQLLDVSTAARAQYFQLYLAVVALTILPLAADLRNRARLYEVLRLSEERYRMFADHSGDIMMQLDAGGRIRFVTSAISRLAGFEPDEMVGRLGIEFVSAADRPKVREAHERTLAMPGATHRFDYRGLRSDGTECWFEASSRAVVGHDGEVVAVLSVIRDVSERKRTEASLSAAAMTDPLTELPNRRAFWAAAEQVLARRRKVPGCIAVLDLDHFKRINDRHGHAAGDLVLRHFARLAGGYVRERDILARIGGEEFALLLPGASLADAARICERLRAGIAGRSALLPDGGKVRVTVSGGVAELGSDGLDAALRRADLALYEAKGGGRDQLCLAA